MNWPVSILAILACFNWTPPWIRKVSHSQIFWNSCSYSFHYDVSVRHKNLKIILTYSLSTSLSIALPLFRKQVSDKLQNTRRPWYGLCCIKEWHWNSHYDLFVAIMVVCWADKFICYYTLVFYISCLTKDFYDVYIICQFCFTDC